MKAPTLFAYLPEAAAVALCKLAEGEKKPKPSLLAHPMVTSALGMAAGTLAGAGAAHLTNAAFKHFKGKDIPVPFLHAAAPVVGAGLGLAYNLAQAHQMEALRHAAESSDD